MAVVHAPIVELHKPRHLVARENERLKQRLHTYSEVIRTLRAELEQARQLAMTCHLTGVPNRRAFEDRLAQACEEARRFEMPLSLVLCDVDHFKRYNDTNGHQAGDEALSAVASALVCSVREIDMVARVGGEEFAVILPRCDDAGASVAAERARVNISQLPQGVTASFGVATFGAKRDSARAMYRDADRALYGAKGSGRNRVCVWRGT